MLNRTLYHDEIPGLKQKKTQIKITFATQAKGDLYMPKDGFRYMDTLDVHTDRGTGGWRAACFTHAEKRLPADPLTNLVLCLF